ncbi:hypothetical protein D9757_007816 [Collybiopsis confluens]|uniref:Uncharacterized protein n=1 Tax=Collybiopsis confluens TaxID=2823264 RepID=A0A8H5HPY7_9AGAR|nr:hypothetical protein D9757_007816 [Collybiopsis confluens]
MMSSLDPEDDNDYDAPAMYSIRSHTLLWLLHSPHSDSAYYICLFPCGFTPFLFGPNAPCSAQVINTTEDSSVEHCIGDICVGQSRIRHGRGNHVDLASYLSSTTFFGLFTSSSSTIFVNERLSITGISLPLNLNRGTFFHHPIPFLPPLMSRHPCTFSPYPDFNSSSASYFSDLSNGCSKMEMPKIGSEIHGTSLWVPRGYKRDPFLEAMAMEEESEMTVRRKAIPRLEEQEEEEEEEEEEMAIEEESNITV